MANTRTLLVIHHSQTGSTRRMADAVLRGANSDLIEGVEVCELDALEADESDVLRADAIIIGTPENFGYMSGAIKYFLDRVYYPCLDQVDGKPYALFVSAGNDGSGAISSLRRILSGLSLREVQEPVLAVGELSDAHLADCEELGMTLAAGLEQGIF